MFQVGSGKDSTAKFDIMQHPFDKYNFVLLVEAQKTNVEHVSPYLPAQHGSFDTVFDSEAHKTFMDFVQGQEISREMGESSRRSETQLANKSGLFIKSRHGVIQGRMNKI